MRQKISREKGRVPWTTALVLSSPLWLGLRPAPARGAELPPSLSPSLSPSPPAAARAEARTAARREMEEGNRNFERGGYESALGAYRRAYALFPSPNLLFNLAQAHRNLGHDLDAASYYERFLAEAPEASPAVRREADGYLQGLDARLARLVVVATLGKTALSRGVELTLDGAMPEQGHDDGPENGHDDGALPRTLRVLPGSHVLAARAGADGTWAEEKVVVRAGELRQVSFALASSGGTGPASPPERVAAVSSGKSGDVVPDSSLVEARPAETSESRSLFAASVRADLNASLKGAGWSGAVVWLGGQHLAARGGGFFWPHEGSALWGGFVGLRWLPWEGTVRPFVEAEALLYERAGPHPGGRVAIGLDVTVLRHLEIGAGFGFYFVSQNTRTPLSETTFWSPFVELSLF